jgi:hypothetical protein
LYDTHGDGLCREEETPQPERLTRVDIGCDALARPVAEVVTECQVDRKASVQDEIETRF